MDVIISGKSGLKARCEKMKPGARAPWHHWTSEPSATSPSSGGYLSVDLTGQAVC